MQFKDHANFHEMLDETIENAMMTPTFKLKKNIILKKYQLVIDTMYQ